jgi:hypothetical protein
MFYKCVSAGSRVRIATEATALLWRKMEGCVDNMEFL